VPPPGQALALNELYRLPSLALRQARVPAGTNQVSARSAAVGSARAEARRLAGEGDGDCETIRAADQAYTGLLRRADRAWRRTGTHAVASLSAERSGAGGDAALGSARRRGGLEAGDVFGRLVGPALAINPARRRSPSVRTKPPTRSQGCDSGAAGQRDARLRRRLRSARPPQRRSDHQAASRDNALHRVRGARDCATLERAAAGAIVATRSSAVLSGVRTRPAGI
jgi:hypothetical protein